MSGSRQLCEHKPTDTKIRDLILSRITLPMVKEGILLASAIAPELVIPNIIKKKEKRGQCHRKRLVGKGYPIGLLPVEGGDFLNALMQLLLFVPTLRDLFAYVPQSLQPFSHFIDQYLLDMQNRESAVSVDTAPLLHCLRAKFPHLFISRTDPVQLHDIVLHFHAAAVGLPLVQAGCLKPEWQLVWHPEEPLMLQFVDKCEWLVGINKNQVHANRKKVLESHYVLSDRISCFELDGFIEYRPDEQGMGAYFAYLKMDEGWVQCRNERISLLNRGTMLQVSLRRGVLFHYRKISLRKQQTWRG